MKGLNDILDLIARIFIATIFIFDAFDSLMFYKPTMEKMISYGITWHTEFWLNLSLVFLVIGGIFLLMGYRLKFAAFLLFLYWFPLTFFVYSFWNEPAGSLEQREMAILFMKNIAICGGLLFMMVHGSGRYSIKRLLDRRKMKNRI